MADEANRPKPFTPTQERIAKPMLHLFGAINTWMYRLSGGRLGGRWMYGAPILLLVTTGRKSGQRRTSPLLYLKDGERVILVGSQGGMSTSPHWVANAAANPDVEIEIGSERFEMTARRASKEEKARYWPDLVKMYPDYADYQARTTRDIPVLILEPRRPGPAR